MKTNEFIIEKDGNTYSSSHIKFQKIAPSHNPSKLQELCKSLNIIRGDNVFVKDQGDFQHCVFIRAGEKMIHVRNYVTNQLEACDPKIIYTQVGVKYMPILRKSK